MNMFGTKTPAADAPTDQTQNDPAESNPGGNKIESPTAAGSPTETSNPVVTRIPDQNNSTDALQERLDQADGNKELDAGKDKDQTYESRAKPYASINDLNIDVDEVQNRDPGPRVFAEVHAADAGIGEQKGDDTDLTVYSSHPVQRLHIGAYQFENTILKLKPDQVDEFENLLGQLPPQDRLNVRKIDTKAADQIVQDRLSATASATRAFDSSVGRSALQQLQSKVPVVGTEALESMNEPKIGLAEGSGNEPAVVETKPQGEAAQ